MKEKCCKNCLYFREEEVFNLLMIDIQPEQNKEYDIRRVKIT
jgi:hypothetical protein